MFIGKNRTTYFDSFAIEHIHPEVLNKINSKSIKHKLLRRQSNNSLMCGFYCIAFLEYAIAGKSLLNYTFFSNAYNKNDKIIYKHTDKYYRRKDFTLKKR